MVGWWWLGVCSCHTNHVLFVVDRWIYGDTDIFYLHETTPNDSIERGEGGLAQVKEAPKKKLIQINKKIELVTNDYHLRNQIINASTEGYLGTSWMRNTRKKTWHTLEKRIKKWMKKHVNIRISENNADILCFSNVPSARHFAATIQVFVSISFALWTHDLVSFLGNWCPKMWRWHDGSCSYTLFMLRVQ